MFTLEKLSRIQRFRIRDPTFDPVFVMIPDSSKWFRIRCDKCKRGNESGYKLSRIRDESGIVLPSVNGVWDYMVSAYSSMQQPFGV